MQQLGHCQIGKIPADGNIRKMFISGKVPFVCDPYGRFFLDMNRSTSIRFELTWPVTLYGFSIPISAHQIYCLSHCLTRYLRPHPGRLTSIYTRSNISWSTFISARSRASPLWSEALSYRPIRYLDLELLLSDVNSFLYDRVQ